MTQSPVWKPIGEASSSMDQVLYIERIDGYRIPVSRYAMMPMMPVDQAMQRASLDDMENQNRIQREIIRVMSNRRLTA